MAPLGAVIEEETAHKLEVFIADAVGKGATVISGGTATGVLIDATAIDKVTDQMRLYSEESFGPIVAIIRARDEDHAIALANDSEYGLSASVFTRDGARGLRVARQIKSGICHVNGPTVHDEAQMPCGGVKASGYGRFGGQAGVSEFTHLSGSPLKRKPGIIPSDCSSRCGRWQFAFGRTTVQVLIN